MIKTQVIRAGKLFIGGDWPLSIQTMWKSPLPTYCKDTGAQLQALQPILSAISELEALGCNLIRFAVPSMDAAQVLGHLSTLTTMPLVADIHFDWQLALRCLDFPLAKIRINPGNIGAEWKVKEVLAKAKAQNTALRIGVNEGSLPVDLRNKEDRANAILEATERELRVCEKAGFTNMVFSLKTSDIEVCLDVNRKFSAKHSYPLHLGLTEAGPLIGGIARSSFALTTLLREGIGDTIRVSLSDSESTEVIAGREILACANPSLACISLISCPRCGRADFDSHAFMKRWERRLYGLKKKAVIAIMGCAVNGPGEARHADLAISGAGKKLLLFKKGKLIRTFSEPEADTIFHEELDKLE